ncbi:MAG: 30S ribosomal protein S4 [Mycoplasma sp.]
MSRYTGSIYKKSRRLGFSLLENDKEFSKGKKRTYAPGQHGNKRIKLSGYGEQLQEKQKLMYLYGLNDRQFRRIFQIARKHDGVLTINLLRTLESRLDSLVFRMGFANTRRGARQLVSHGHILVNGKKLDIPSALININDEIAIKAKSVDRIDLTNAKIAEFVKVDEKAKKGVFTRYPERNELPENINESYVVEWFKRFV